MSGMQEFCLDRAREAHAEAEATNLPNVRERFLIAEAAWKQMAARAGRTGRLRRPG